MNNRQTILVLLLLLVCISGGFFLFTKWEQLEWPPVKPTNTVFAPSSTPSFTPLPPTEFYAVTILDAGCYDWSYQLLTNIDSSELMNVRGRNKEGTWFMVRWPKFTRDCWVESSYVKPSNFSPEDLFVISAPFPPLFTLTSTLTLTSTSTPSLTPTRTRSVSTAATRTPTPTKGDAIGMTNTPTNPSVTPPTPTNTPATPPTPTKTPATPPTPTNTPVTPPTPTNTPVTPPTPTNTPSGPRQCNDGIDNDGDGKTDFPADDGCRNNGDDSE